MKKRKGLTVLIFVIIIMFFTNCAQEESKEKWLDKHLRKMEEISDIGESEKSFEEAKEKMKNNLAMKVVNFINTYLSHLQIPPDDKISLLIRDELKEHSFMLIDGLKELIEFRGKYFDKKNHKFYVLGVIPTERVKTFLTSAFSKLYNPDIIFQKLTEKYPEIYKAKINVSSQYANKIVSILKKNGLAVDNFQWFVEINGEATKIDESSLASFAGLLYTVKTQYVISIKDKNGRLIGQIRSSIGKGVSNSKTEAFNKALADVIININEIEQYIPLIKENITQHIKDIITQKLTMPPSNLGNIERMIQKEEYLSAEAALEKSSIVSKEFPQSLVLYLKLQGIKEKNKLLSNPNENNAKGIPTRLILVILILLLLLLFIIWIIKIYNLFVKQKMDAKEKYSNIDVLLQRRYDLIPNYVKAVEKYLGHENKTLKEVTEARNWAAGAREKGDLKEMGEAEKKLSDLLGKLFALVVVENYPNLKADQHTLKLQEQLKEVEDKIAAAREDYNFAVKKYNTAIQVFPNIIVANILKFKPLDFFIIEEPEAKKAPPI